MTSTIGRRLAKIEASRRGGWNAWLHVPLREWPDHLLAAFIVDQSTMLPTEQAQALLREMPDDFLRAIADGKVQA